MNVLRRGCVSPLPGRGQIRDLPFLAAADAVPPIITGVEATTPFATAFVAHTPHKSTINPWLTL